MTLHTVHSAVDDTPPLHLDYYSTDSGERPFPSSVEDATYAAEVSSFLYNPPSSILEGIYDIRRNRSSVPREQQKKLIIMQLHIYLFLYRVHAIEIVKIIEPRRYFQCKIHWKTHEKRDFAPESGAVDS